MIQFHKLPSHLFTSTRYNNYSPSYYHLSHITITPIPPITVTPPQLHLRSNLYVGAMRNEHAAQVQAKEQKRHLFTGHHAQWGVVEWSERG